jgi:deoxyribodipyrimidine photo-lyase
MDNNVIKPPVQKLISQLDTEIDQLNPVKYARTRNYVNGHVSYLSKYISRGFISTRYVFEKLNPEKFTWSDIEKFVQELAWREYFQRIHQNIGEHINNEISNSQNNISNQGIPKSITQAHTGIDGIDNAISKLYESGYMHNHVRMYTASLVCNIAQSHWMIPAKWMYYHLLDGDWASNACSWQWVAGTLNNKKYYANQENINKYCLTSQTDTILDKSYEQLNNLSIPKTLLELADLNLSTKLPTCNSPLELNQKLPLLVYTSYQLDPMWYSDIDANRVLLFEPSHFEKYPIDEKVFEHILNLSKEIADLQVFVGSFDSLKEQFIGNQLYYKEHPFSIHFKGKSHDRAWLCPEIKGHYQSFFKYWKKCEPILKQEFENKITHG